LTDKYQSAYLDAGDRYYAYTTLSHFGFALLAASSLIAAVQALEGHRLTQSAVRLAAIVLLAVGGLYSSYANAVVATNMQANSDRWRAFDLIMQVPEMRQAIRGRTVVAPKLWDSYWQVSPRPTYWKEYATLKYGENIEFQGRPNNSGLETAVFFDFSENPKCGAIFSLLAKFDPTIPDYSATKLHVATTRPSSNSFLTYRSVSGREQLVALRSLFNGAASATVATEPFDPRSLHISCED